MNSPILINILYAEEYKKYEGSVCIVVLNFDNSVSKVSFMDREKAQNWLQENATRNFGKTVLLGFVSIAGEVVVLPKELGSNKDQSSLKPN